MEVQSSLRFLRAYARNPKGALLDLKNSIGVPEFPDSKWKNLIEGRSIDLDHVFAGHYSSAQDSKTTTNLGDHFEIPSKVSVPAKRVQTMGDWITAWHRTSHSRTLPLLHWECISRGGQLGYWCELPKTKTFDGIFFFKALAVVSAIHSASET